MKLINDIYKTKNLAEYGRFISFCLIALIVIGPFVIPKFTPNSSKQLLSINGNHLKYDDKAIVSDFFNSIKSNDGYLFLGTSESTSIKFGGNYYNFLNDDPGLKVKFTILAGAGRTCGKYIPIFLNHKEDVKSLKIFYYINPVYWREDLCNPNKAYWKRYSNYGVLQNVSISNEEKETYYREVTEYMNGLNSGEKSTFVIDYWLRKYRAAYFLDLWYMVNPDLYSEKNTYVREKKNDLSIYKSFGEIDYELIDTVSNEKRESSGTHSFEPNNNEVQYRYNELTSFIHLCRDLEINITYILGPYNQRFIETYAPNELKGYQTTIKNIEKILNEQNVNYIDATDGSSMAGTFSDAMHNSSFGAYLIYLKIKHYINEI
jgi:hypothetical protein